MRRRWMREMAAQEVPDDGRYLRLQGGGSLLSPQAMADLDWVLRYGDPSREHLCEAASVLNVVRSMLLSDEGPEMFKRFRREAKKQKEG